MKSTKYKLKMNQLLTKKNLSKILWEVDVVLKENEINMLMDSIRESVGQSDIKIPEFLSESEKKDLQTQIESNLEERMLKIQDFLDFAIKESIEMINFDDQNHFVHPVVVQTLEKALQLFKSLDISNS